MTTPLHSTLKRALTIDGREYVVTLTEAALKLTLKGKRNGFEVAWTQLVNGEAALAVALHASVGAFAAKDKSALPMKQPVTKRPTVQPPAAHRPPAKRPAAKHVAAKRATAKRSS
jgi:hypothetical protein